MLIYRMIYVVPYVMIPAVQYIDLQHSQDHNCEKNDCVDETPCGGNMESELQDKLLQER